MRRKSPAKSSNVLPELEKFIEQWGTEVPEEEPMFSFETEEQAFSVEKPRKKSLSPEERERREKKRQRRYNKSAQGRARHRRWEQSSQGKRTRWRVYLERREWLDQVKGQRGCLICHEKNPLVLRFRVRDGKKGKFSPGLQNISRSKGDWLKVLKVSDVLCVRCLILEKQGRKPLDGRTREARKAREGCREGQETIKPSVEMVKSPENHPLTKHGATISENKTLRLGANVVRPNLSQKRRNRGFAKTAVGFCPGRPRKFLKSIAQAMLTVFKRSSPNSQR